MVEYHFHVSVAVVAGNSPLLTKWDSENILGVKRHVVPLAAKKAPRHVSDKCGLSYR